MVHSFVYRQRRLEVRMRRHGESWCWSHGLAGDVCRETGVSPAAPASAALRVASDAARAWVDRQFAVDRAPHFSGSLARN